MEIKDISFHNESPVQIRFNDIDLLGHVNNATLQEYFDLGRMHYIHKAFGDDLFNGTKALIIASVHTDFMMPTFLQEDIVVKTAVLSIGGKSLQMEQHIVETNKNQVKVVCKSVMVGIDTSLHQSIEIPQEWRDIIGKMENREF